MKSAMHLRALVALVVLFSSVAWAEEATGPMSVLDAQQLVEQLNAALEERDAMILELAARVRALEHRLNSGAVPAPSFDKRPELDIAMLSAEEELDEADRLAQTALERTLIQSGGLLLPAGRIEIEPSFAYRMFATDTIDIDCLLIADILCIGDINSKQSRYESYSTDLSLRLGLPWDLQFDARVPFGHVTSTAVFGDGSSERASTTELGDIEIALSRQLMREKGWRPDLLAELRWKGRSGGDPFDQQEGSVATGTGFDDLKLGFTMVKVRDPLVLFGNVNYTYSLADDKPEIGEVRPGDTISAQLGLALALNLETSMHFGWTQGWTENTRVNGEEIPGTSRRPGSLNIGATYVPAAGRSITFDVGFGLTDDAPDVTAQFSFPLSFERGDDG
jgi:hypothetical protein